MADQHRIRKRLKLYEAQKGLCVYCQQPMVLEYDYNGPDAATYEHIVPRSKGGKQEGNLIMAHGICNRRRADRPLYFLDGKWHIL